MSENAEHIGSRRDSTLLFIIGPAGVGKTTSGELLAQDLGFRFVDLDAEFNQQVGPIQSWIDEFGYPAYCKRNTELFYDLVVNVTHRTVYAISSGFLLYDEIDTCFGNNADVLTSLGISIVLLPSESLSDSTDIVVSRLLQRRPWLNRQKETQKFQRRFSRYYPQGDIKIFSAEAPQVVAQRMKSAYLEYLRTNQMPSQDEGVTMIVSGDEDRTRID
ncbi:MAG TPA: shikimate kinase [Streptosporangiaceae bacterium]|nr:shikimate kinase [Streptosporangiaceae bacterium]